MDKLARKWQAHRNRMLRSPSGALALCAALLPGAQAQTLDELAQMSIDDLGSVQITSVSKKAQSLGDAPAAVFVITRDDIRRSGRRSLPEILRLAPNLQVARVNASEYAITARGFNATTANKLLVLINGRSVYTPLYSGVFWDTPDQLPENIEQIEVISGPGGTLWGANAVNGVINIITRKAQDTEGRLLSAEAGQDERGLALRYGAPLGENASFRLTARGFRRDASFNSRSGARQPDEWDKNNLEFNLDWKKGRDSLNLDLNTFRTTIDQQQPLDKTVSGSHALLRWRRELAGAGSLQVQGYVDHGHRVYPGTFGEKRDTYDLEMEHRFVRGRHDLVWGAAYRHSRDHVDNSLLLAFLPASRSLTHASLFAQDTVALDERLSLVLGVKAEHNSFTGIEWQPNARIAWKTPGRDLLWSAISRAVRTPSRIDTDFYSPADAPHTLLAGGPGFQSEKLTALEVGYRLRPLAGASLSVSLFYHDYDKLRSIEAGPEPTLANKLGGSAYGVEVWGGYQASERWRLDAGYKHLGKDLELAPDSRDVTSLGADADPRNQFLLRSSLRPRDDLELDLTFRTVGALAAPAIPSYNALDAHVAWTVSKTLTLSLWGANLLDRRHPEFGGERNRSDLGRNFSVRALWKF